MVDALGNELVIGNTYGYSSRDAGYIVTCIGVLEGVKKKATLRIISRKNFLYGDEVDRSYWNNASAVAVTPIILFPVNLPTTVE